MPKGAEAARLGGDEFVVMLPGAGAESAAALGGRIRDVLAVGLTDAGFPLRISAGISTYPFDGATPSALLRAADQALYAAKSAGKDRIALARRGGVLPHLGLPAHARDARNRQTAQRFLPGRRGRSGRGFHPARSVDERAPHAPPVGGRTSLGTRRAVRRRLRSFTESDVGIARLLTTQAERRLEVVASESRTRRRPRVYELPPDDGETLRKR